MTNSLAVEAGGECSERQESAEVGNVKTFLRHPIIFVITHFSTGIKAKITLDSGSAVRKASMATRR